MTKGRLGRLALIAGAVSAFALLTSFAIGEPAAFAIASVLFVALCFRLRCQSLAASIAFGLLFTIDAVVTAATQPLGVGHDQVAFRDFPWWPWLQLMVLATPLVAYLPAPVALAIATHLYFNARTKSAVGADE